VIMGSSRLASLLRFVLPWKDWSAERLGVVLAVLAD